MLQLPGKLTPAKFLQRHWQKAPLFMPEALDRVAPAVTRNELAWLATLDDVESRLVFTERGERLRYRAEPGPFDPEDLAALPPRDWTLLVHDVEKHLPALRRLFDVVPFVPDWRIDDLMVSFAAPGGGVGPHRDNYDVFLCQGIGVREWHVSVAAIPDDPEASDDLALTAPFDGDEVHTASHGDVLYLPPGVTHWGTAQRASLTYSIGMRAPSASELLEALAAATGDDARFYADPDLDCGEARPGYISDHARERTMKLLQRAAGTSPAGAGRLLGRCVTATKNWLRPEAPDQAEIEAILENPRRIRALRLHGMARLAWDDTHVYLNGASCSLDAAGRAAIETLCRERRGGPFLAGAETAGLLRWLLAHGAFGIDVPR